MFDKSVTLICQHKDKLFKPFLLRNSFQREFVVGTCGVIAAYLTTHFGIVLATNRLLSCLQ